MKKILLYAILSVVGSGSLRAESAAVLSGAWRGDLKMGNVALPHRILQYSEIRETIAPEVLEIIKEFILRNSQ